MGVADGSGEFPALAEVVGLVVVFPAGLEAALGGCHPTRATITTLATATSVPAPKIQRIALAWLDAPGAVVDHGGGAGGVSYGGGGNDGCHPSRGGGCGPILTPTLSPTSDDLRSRWRIVADENVVPAG